jgi:hypothetical protein
MGGVVEKENLRRRRHLWRDYGQQGGVMFTDTRICTLLSFSSFLGFSPAR